MAVADLILGAVFLPFQIYIYLGPAYSLWTPKLHQRFYVILFYNVTVKVFLQGSFFSAVAISIERFYAIYWPLQHRTLSGRPYRVVIFAVWTLSIMFSAISSMLSVLLSTEINFYFLSSYYLILLFIVCCCNVGIWKKCRHQMIATQQQNRTSQNQRLTKTLLFVSIVALLSWLPFIIINYVGFTSSTISVKIFFTTVVLLFCNSVVNPIVYALRIPELRQDLRLCCFRRQVAAVDMKEIGRRNNRVAALMPELQLKILSIDPGEQNRTWQALVEIGIDQQTSIKNIFA